MKLTDAKFTKKYNTGNYESEEYSLTAIVEETESAVGVLTSLKSLVADAFAGEDSTAKVEAPKKAAKKAAKKVEPVAEEIEDEDDDEALAPEQEETEDSDDDEEIMEESEEDEEEEEEVPVKKKASSSPGKKFKKKEQVYSRTNEQHKVLFSSTLKAVAPDWKKTDAGKAKAKTVSQKMEGKAFLDENGEVVAEFKAEVKKLMAAKK